MATLNSNYLKISRRYIFPLIEEKLKEVKKNLPKADILNLGVGDIALPLAKSIAEGIKRGATEMEKEVFGYGPPEGYPFLREKIINVNYQNTSIESDEVFVSDGINTDLCSMQELFSLENRVGIINPAYPVYNDLNILQGRENIFSIPLLEENGFQPKLPNEPLDIIFLCSPNNPTGIAMTREELQTWVDWARKNRSILFYDAAYRGFISSEEIPKTIYEIPHADEVAIEFQSFSKSSGFTGVRLGYAVVPKRLQVYADSKPLSLHKFWSMRQHTKTNGTSFPIQKAGYYALSDEGQKETNAQISMYKKQADKIKKALNSIGATFYGGEHSPYIFWKTPNGNSWEFFEFLLNRHHMITIPGEGFGSFGEGFVRLSCFLSEEDGDKAMQRIESIR